MLAKIAAQPGLGRAGVNVQQVRQNLGSLKSVDRVTGRLVRVVRKDRIQEDGRPLVVGDRRVIHSAENHLLKGLGRRKTAVLSRGRFLPLFCPCGTWYPVCHRAKHTRPAGECVHDNAHYHPAIMSAIPES